MTEIPAEPDRSRRARRIFLTTAGVIALAVGGLAALAPAALLATKGVEGATTEVWMREVGVLLVAIGVLAVSVSAQPPSPVLRRVLAANALAQFALFPIEIVAVANGVLTLPAGVVPNSIVHLVLGAGFVWFAIRMPSTRR